MNAAFEPARPMTASPGYAGFWQRFVALFVNWIILSSPNFLFWALFLAGIRSGSAALLLVGLVVWFVGPIWLTVVYCRRIARTGQGWGHSAMGIYLLKAANGQPPSAWGVFGREIVRIISWLPLGLGVFWMLWDPKRQTWHDQMLGTVVVRSKTTFRDAAVATRRPDSHGSRHPVPAEHVRPESVVDVPPQPVPPELVVQVPRQHVPPESVVDVPPQPVPPEPVVQVPPQPVPPEPVVQVPPQPVPDVPPQPVPPSSPHIGDRPAPAMQAPPPEVDDPWYATDNEPAAAPALVEATLVRSPRGASTPQVVFESGGSVPLVGVVVVGRNPSLPDRFADAIPVAVDDPTMTVSKTHAAFGVDGQAPWVVDLGSANGVVIESPEGAVVSVGADRVEIPSGSTLRLGACAARVEPGR